MGIEIHLHSEIKVDRGRRRFAAHSVPRHLRVFAARPSHDYVVADRRFTFGGEAR